MKNAQIIWPDIFVTGEIPASCSDVALCRDALSAWACAMSGAALPDNFGGVMNQIARRLGTDGTPKSFSDWALSRGLAEAQTPENSPENT